MAQECQERRLQQELILRHKMHLQESFIALSDQFLQTTVPPEE